MKKTFLSILLAAGVTAGSQAAVRITEWEYNGSEFIEFTNLGSTAVDFTGWSFDDSSRSAGSVSLSGFGSVAAGESVILSEVSAADFRIEWNLATTVKVIGLNAQNLGRSDEINLYDNFGTLVDRLTFGDQDFPGSIRTDTASGWAPFDALGTNTVIDWVRSTEGDAQGSYSSNSGFVGSPGVHAVPEPGVIGLAMVGLGLIVWRLRRRTMRA
jgi:predicted extracellular nuclease